MIKGNPEAGVEGGFVVACCSFAREVVCFMGTGVVDIVFVVWGHDLIRSCKLC